VSIATTTPAHFPIALECLERGVHVLVEKPITETPDQARALIETARRRGCLLQVGHLERFNSAILALEGVLGTPRFIESHRLAPFKERGTDVNVVLDLMIHDIDLIQSLVGLADRVDRRGGHVGLLPGTRHCQRAHPLCERLCRPTRRRAASA